MAYTVDDFRNDLKGILSKVSFSGSEKKALKLKGEFLNDKKEKFMDYTLQDGSVVRIPGDTPCEGMPITVMDPSGKEIPLPDGTYTIPDTGMILIVQGGMISSVEGGAGAGAPAAGGGQEGMTDEQKTQQQTVKRQIESIVKELVYSKQEVDEKFNSASSPASLADYPWDQCIADQTAKYGDKETAQKVCASIKNGTVSHRAQVEMAAMVVDLQIENAKILKELDGYKTKMAATEEVVKNIFSAIEKFAAAPSEPSTQKGKDGIRGKQENENSKTSLEKSVQKIRELAKM